MANVDQPSGQQLEKQLTPENTYAANADLIYGIMRWFFPESFVQDSINAVVRDFAKNIGATGYKRYSNLVLLRSLFDFISKEKSIKVPFEASPIEAFCLLLRDRYQISPANIGAIVGASEGSVRTRLTRLRARIFSNSEPTGGPLGHTITAIQNQRPLTQGHQCIRTQELIEDSHIPSSRLGRFSAPQVVVRAIGECARCEKSLTQRLNSVQYFSELPIHEVPPELRTFPVSPLIVKEGRRVLLNWSAAPWYLKALFEGLLATSLVLGIVLSIPRMKSLYEFWLERRLDLYSVAELAIGLGNQNDSSSEAQATNSNLAQPLAPKSGEQPEVPQGQAAQTATNNVTPGSGDSSQTTSRVAVKSQTEFGGRGSETVTSDKIYRIVIRSDAPEMLKDSVMKALITANFSQAEDDGLSGGVELAGGVIYDVLIPVKDYKPLEAALTKLGDTQILITRAKQRGVPGKARLKILLKRL